MIHVGTLRVMQKKPYNLLCRPCWVTATYGMRSLKSFWHFSVFDSRTFCSNILLDDLAMHTAFCSNTRVHTRFVELTASPCRWTHIFFSNGETLNRKRGTNFISELVSWNSSCVFNSFFLLDNHDDCRKKCVNRAFVAPFLALTCDCQLWFKCIPFCYVCALFVAEWNFT